MKNCANCVERQRFSQDKFQTFICQLLAVGSVLALLPPLLITLLSQQEPGCLGTTFNVVAHYTLADWIMFKWDRFKVGMASEYESVCFHLEIEDSTLESGINPSIWIPESEVWLDYAEYDILGGEDVFVSNRSEDCFNLTRIPLGVITWKKYADLLTTNFTPISIRDITDLATMGWVEYTNGSIKNVNDSIDALYFAHGHPNHTSGGLLGLVELYSDMANEYAGTNDTISFNKNCEPLDSKYGDDFDVDDLESVNNTNTSILMMMDATIMTTSIDYSLPWVMMSRGPTFLHMTFGAESDVAMMNEQYKEQLEFMWNDTLAFIYLEETYLLTHPMCKMTGASWWSDGVEEMADEFVNWITDQESTHIPEMVQYGLRPIEWTFPNDTANATTASPSLEPTMEPTTSAPIPPTATAPPSSAPTSATTDPSVAPSVSPTTVSPTTSPTSDPTVSPTTNPPTLQPTAGPTDNPTEDPTETAAPTANPPSSAPTSNTSEPTASPTTPSPTASPVNTTTTMPPGYPGSIMTEENGVSSTYQEITQFYNPDDRTINCVQRLYQDVKRPLRIALMLDVSTYQSETTSDGDTRWSFVKKAVQQLPTYLEDDVNITLTCFAESMYEWGGAGQNCASGESWPDGTLETNRGEVYDYFANEMLKTENAYFYEAFNTTYQMVYNEMVNDEDGLYKYVMLVITHPDAREDGTDEEVEEQLEAEASLLHLVGMALEPEDTVPVYALHYFGLPSQVTSQTLEAIADRTNGAYAEVRDDGIKSALKDFLYYF